MLPANWKHGPIALTIRTLRWWPWCHGSVYLKTVSNVEEIKARQGRLVLIEPPAMNIWPP